MSPTRDFGTYEELAALPPVKPCANLQGLINRHACQIANRQLARKGRFLQFADHEPGHVVKGGSHDSAVGSTGCAFECAPQHKIGDHFTIVESHLEFNARRIGPTPDSSVFEPAPTQDRPLRAAPHEGETVARGRFADRECQFVRRLRDRCEHIVRWIVRRKCVAERSQTGGRSFPCFFGPHPGKCRKLCGRVGIRPARSWAGSGLRSGAHIDGCCCHSTGRWGTRLDGGVGHSGDPAYGCSMPVALISVGSLLVVLTFLLAFTIFGMISALLGVACIAMGARMYGRR